MTVLVAARANWFADHGESHFSLDDASGYFVYFIYAGGHLQAN